MARRETGIRPVGNRWQVRVRVGMGRRIERTTPPGASYDDAVALKNSIRRAQIDAVAGRRPDALIDTALDKWLAEYVRHQKSAKRTQQRVNVLREFTAGKRMSELGAVAAQLKTADAKPSTINRYLSVLRRVGNLAASDEWGWLDRAPQIKMLSEAGNERHIYLESNMVERIARLCTAEVGDFVRLSALTGLRRSELLGLTPDRVVDGVILLSARTKTGRPRAVPLTPEGRRIAARRLPWSITKDDIRGQFERARKQVGRRDVQLRDMRHTFASWVLHKSQNMKAVQELLGHSQINTTQRYAHLAQRHLRQAVGGLPRVGKGKR